MPSPKARPYATDAAWLNLARGRFTLSMQVLQSTGWDKTGDSAAISAEVIKLGHIRLHLRPAVEELRQKADQEALNELGDGDALEARRQAIADRFHDVRFSKSDNNRVVMPAEVVMAIVGDSCREDRVRLFVQAGKECIDVMTNAVRMSRHAAESD